ncbi:polymer-forming cytoskeletal protein [Piscinibacter gummiphilus]|uniref:Polymer-forming cytoskeletal protein n=1 Tax=Piscinibacter gummiphilus TaxID=946333 RepID=A0ABZ0CQX2_9BURK|nr:polymer-forming cytoskeletal protein [Piscinibacter gummiphilus]WOB07238.1 polymer-forming cytoskeletal protein [Piscinibacter gummiphilus]
MPLIRHTLVLLLLLSSLPALAVNYTFPGNMPTGCTGSNGTYTCPGGSLAFNDTVTINGVVPATITVNGNLNTSNARINQSGSASNLTIRVNGTLTTDYQAVINANVQATVVNSNDTQVTFGGSISTTTGAINLGFANTVGGNITSTSGAISIGGTTQVAGNVSCNCALELEYDARISGNVSAATLVTNGRAFLQGGSITTTGNVDIGYGSTLSASVTAGGSIRLRGNIQASQCLRTTGSSNLRLDWADRANGGVCCGALGSCTTSCVTNGSGAAMPALCSGTPPSTPPARFNAFETSTAAGATSGVIRTKVSGTTFSVAVVAVNTAGTGVETTFTGNVRVEVLDASSTTGTVNASTGCNPNWTVASGTTAVTLNFAASDAGRKNVSLTVAEAFPNARIRVSYPDTGTATVTGCSTDNFAIRPASFTSFAVTDATSSTAGTARSLTSTVSPRSTDLTGNFVHKAGQPFTVRATAVNGTGTTTALYSGTAVGTATACSTPSSACGGVLGTPNVSASTLTPSTGVVITHSATYSEAGAFNLQLVDSSFANVDATDGSTAAERNITSGTLTVGRFVPDHFDVVALVTPVLRTFDSSSCTTRSFTYLGQPFGYATTPQASVLARNAAGSTTVNYPNAKLAALSVSQGYTPTVSATPGLDSSAATLPSLTASGSGIGLLAAQSSDRLTMVRSATTPVAPFAASIALTWSVSDGSEAAVTGNGSITTTTPLVYSSISFDAGNEFRYGQLRLGSAYGNELLSLAVPVETQHWNGTSFVTNAADQCTALPTSSLSLANFRGSLAACETAPTASSASFSSGRAVMRLAAPGNGNKGSVDGTIQLGATITAGAVRCSAVGAATSAAVPANLPWLQSKAPGGTTYDQNPSARFSFGQYKSPLIQLREMY